jgi:hypothetical protein
VSRANEQANEYVAKAVDPMKYLPKIGPTIFQRPEEDK